jgi:hypothetical protein
MPRILKINVEYGDRDTEEVFWQRDVAISDQLIQHAFAPKHIIESTAVQLVESVLDLAGDLPKGWTAPGMSYFAGVDRASGEDRTVIHTPDSEDQ